MIVFQLARLTIPTFYFVSREPDGVFLQSDRTSIPALFKEFFTILGTLLLSRLTSRARVQSRLHTALLHFHANFPASICTFFFGSLLPGPFLYVSRPRFRFPRLFIRSLFKASPATGTHSYWPKTKFPRLAARRTACSANFPLTFATHSGDSYR